MRNRQFILCLLSAFAACGRPHHDGGRGPKPGPHGDFDLNDEERQSLEKWRGSLVKACNVDSVFGGQTNGQDVGIDGRQFLALSGRQLALRDDSGSFAILGEPTGLLGYEVSELQRSAETNGDVTTFAAKVTRDGKACKVEVLDETLYQTELWSALPVVAFGSGKVNEPDEFRASFRADRPITKHGLIVAVAAASQKNLHVVPFIKNRLPDVPSERISEFFPPGQLIDGRHAVELSAYGVAPIIDVERPEIDGADAMMLDLSKPSGTTTVDLLLKPERVAFGDVSTDDVAGLWRVRAEVSWSSISADVRAYKVESVTLGDREPLSAVKFRDCVERRHEIFAATGLYGSGRFSPSYAGALGPCNVFVLAEDLGAAIDADKDLRLRLGTMLAGVTGEPQLQIGGWDWALRLLARRYLKTDASLQDRVDPEGKSPLVAAVDHATHLIDAMVSAREPLNKDRDLLLEAFAFQWSFRGENVDDDITKGLLDGLVNTRAILPDSTVHWIDDAAKEPHQQKVTTAYALSIGDDVKSAIAIARDKAAALALSSDMESLKLATMLQDRPSSKAVHSWGATLDALASFRERDLRQKGDLDASFSLDFPTLARRAITEDWRVQDFKDVEVLTAVAKFVTACENYHTTTVLMRCAGSTVFSRAEGAILAPDFGARYLDLAGILVKRLEALNGGEFAFERSDVGRAFYGPLWKSCDADDFKRHTADLDRHLGALPRAAAFERFEIQDKIRKLLAECT